MTFLQKKCLKNCQFLKREKKNLEPIFIGLGSAKSAKVKSIEDIIGSFGISYGISVMWAESRASTNKIPELVPAPLSASRYCLII